ncbi:hypothetical protein [Rhizobium giardinii]|uniref:Uncharacterized protein n=1 Tax=Rhizobium giardinii TaxID=56731 RepID=A0A7W8UAS4_9HYPH|nr:hypothetical protein [Rhizobium giardinii]MBB5535047.1 hypothetical protein [Rhizobium giardinii]
MSKANEKQKQRQCVFCGQVPKNKNREHILPRWLLELTGDPTRKVAMAIDPDTGHSIEFAWSALVMPACEECNNQYSKLEDRVKGIAQVLLKRLPITSRQAFDLLDWLDKVRVCLWLNQRILQKNVARIDPHLFVGNRIGAKDRLLYVYTLDGNGNGLNAFGIESLIFQHQPSCFALRINDIILLNASADYAFSAGCGFWHPARMESMVDGEFAGQVRFTGYAMPRKVSHPLVPFPLLKAALRLIQPIAQRGSDGQFLGPLRQNESYHLTHMSNPAMGAGIIFRQFDDRVAPIYNLDAPLAFDEVVGDHGTAEDIRAQTYRLQTALLRAAGVLTGSEAAVARARSMQNILAQTNELRATMVERDFPSSGGPDYTTIAFRDAMNAAKANQSEL